VEQAASEAAAEISNAQLIKVRQAISIFSCGVVLFRKNIIVAETGCAIYFSEAGPICACEAARFLPR
jgi:hypothetical protein